MNTPVVIHPLTNEPGIRAGTFSRTNAIGTFTYDDDYLARADAVSIDPASLPLRGGTFTTELNGGIFGAFRDALPDYWGRAVLAARLDVAVEDLDDDAVIDHHASGSSVGVIGFGDDAPRFLPDVSDLDRLLGATHAVESESQADTDDLALLGAATGIGGARPKCSVRMGESDIWLAKLPSKSDRINIPRIEYATMQMAKACGLSVPEMRMIDVNGADVMLIKRFDRAVNRRHGFISALTLMQWDERDMHRWSYLDLADTMRKHGDVTGADELFRRAAFNILVNNTDDHPRNHGFLQNGDAFTLSPLYDVVPSLKSAGVSSESRLAMSVGPEGRAATIDNLIAAHARFGIASRDDAMERIAPILHIVRSWRESFADHGVTDADIHTLSSCISTPR